MRAALSLLVVAGCGDNLEPPVVPRIAVGYDAYLHLDALPRVRISQRAIMRSTYDRTGGNEGADAAHFIRAEPDGTFTTLDVAGPGMLVFARANHWHGSPWHEVIDGQEHVITESSTATPLMPVQNSVFMPADALPAPLAVTWSETNGADLDWVPKPFTTSLRISDERTHHATGYYIVQKFGDTDHLSAPIESWTADPPPSEVLELLESAGTDISPPGDSQARTVDVPAFGEITALEVSGPGMIRRLVVNAPASAALDLANVHLAITWDGRDTPSVDAPIGLLFAGGSLYNRDSRTQLVGGLLANVRFDGERIELALYYPMPFSRSADVVLRGAGTAVTDVRVSVKSTELLDAANTWSYFHASYVDHADPVLGEDLVLLDTTRVEGGGDWCGAFAGTSFTFSDVADLGTLEGDPRFFFDDAQSPQGHGTGTEEWAGGGDYWGGRTSSLPLAGHPTGSPSLAAAQTSADAIQSAYRFLIADAMPFGRNARIQLEHGATNASPEHYRTVTYWYGRPSACLVRTDDLDVGDSEDEQAHDYAAPNSGTIEVISRWEGLNNDLVGSENGRVSSEPTTFTVKVTPSNHGVLLRRTLDYEITDQRAEVWVADDRDDAPFVRAATWFTAGSTTVIYSNPPAELDPPQPIIQTVDRRLREDEVLLPRALTRGRSSLRIQIRPSTRWSELRYTVYSYVL